MAISPGSLDFVRFQQAKRVLLYHFFLSVYARDMIVMYGRMAALWIVVHVSFKQCLTNRQSRYPR